MEIVGRELSGGRVSKVARTEASPPGPPDGSVPALFTAPTSVHTPRDIIKGGGMAMAISPSSCPQSARGACKPQGPHSAQKTRDLSYFVLQIKEFLKYKPLSQHERLRRGLTNKRSTWFGPP